MLAMSTVTTGVDANAHLPFTGTVPSHEGLEAIRQAVHAGDIKAGGPATQRCEELLRCSLGAAGVLMLGSCTAALELSARLLELAPGDEVIMPSFGFASAANAFVLQGATPVFVDIVPGTLNLDPAAVASAVTPRTRAIVPVHYAGVAADLAALSTIAAEHGLRIVEDAAQGLGAAYRGQPLGTIGALGAVSFDATKNITCGAGGALIVNDETLLARAEWLRDCGTDRARFARGTVDHYRWVDAGSNGSLNELAAAYLAPQLRDTEAITASRQQTWDRYHAAFAALEAQGYADRPVVPDDCRGNAHLYFLVMPTAAARTAMLAGLAELGIEATFHFVPLHSAPAGQRYGRAHGALPHTDDLSARLVRLPLWNAMPDDAVERVIAAVSQLAPEAAQRTGTAR